MIEAASRMFLETTSASYTHFLVCYTTGGERDEPPALRGRRQHLGMGRVAGRSVDLATLLLSHLSNCCLGEKLMSPLHKLHLF